MKTHEKYGALKGRIKPLTFVFFPQLVLSLGLIIAGAIWFGTAISGGSVAVVAIILFIIGAAIMVYCLFSLNKCGIFLYENAIVVKEALKSNEMEASEMRAITWSFPGANEVNPRAPRKNNTSCEVVMNAGKKGSRMSDAFYGKQMIESISAWQNNRKVPTDIKDTKGSKRY